MENPPKGLEDKLTVDEREAFFDYSSPRTTAIVLSAILENRLTDSLRLLMHQDPKLLKELFNPSGPLGPFATKINLAYLLRVIDKTTADDLAIVSRIRNKFAHDLSIKTFEGQQITALVQNMKVYSTLKSMEKAARKSKGTDAVSIAYREMLISAFDSTQDSFRECARPLIHHIVK